MSIEIIQSLYRTEKIKWSTHCLERMQVFGYTINHKVLHTVVGSDEEVLYIITAYYPNTIKFMEDLKTRRSK